MIHVGQKFIHGRTIKKLSLEDVAKATKINVVFLQAIEKGDYQKLPSSAYAYGFVRNYARFLGLPEKETLALFRREFAEEKIFHEGTPGITKTKEFRIKRLRIKDKLVLFLLLCLLFGFLLFQFRYLFTQPQFEVTTPKEGQLIKGQEVLVSGKADPNATLYINNTPVTVEGNGTFTKILEVFEGKTTIQVRIVNRFGREKILERRIEVKQ